MEKTIIENTNFCKDTEKPYVFRKLSAPDIFVMSKIISKIGVNEFADCFGKDSLKNLVSNITDNDSVDKTNNDKETDSDDNVASIVGFSVFLEIANIILKNLPSCEEDIYKILSQTSNLDVEEIKSLELSVFAEMVIDFIKQDGFSDFIKVVSKLLK